VYSIGSNIIVPLLDESFIPEVVGQARNHFCDVKEITNMKFSLETINERMKDRRSRSSYNDIINLDKHKKSKSIST